MRDDDIVIVRLDLTRKQADELGRLATESGVTPSEVVRRAMRSYTLPTPFEKLADLMDEDD